ncbi:MAG TPA: twin-arginine translocase subunit TatC [Planctomycetota bacterium]|nr:twin-arginine translocase subunit TatC [Planctomycetota bacterium]
MSLGEHLVELRKRLMRSALAVLLFTIAGFWAAEFVWDALRTPVVAIARDHDAIINYPSISGAFDIRIQIALVIGIVASSPIWLYQIFAFLVPGLNRREKRYTFGFFFSAVPLFLAGCVAGWWVFPHIVEVLTSFVPKEDASFLDAKYYLDFVLKLVLATGIAFVLPVFLVLLNFIGILRGTTILKGWRWAILTITIFTAIATPAADVIAMFLLAIPMIALYFSAVGVAIVRDRIVDRRQSEALPA